LKQRRSCGGEQEGPAAQKRNRERKSEGEELKTREGS